MPSVPISLGSALPSVVGGTTACSFDETSIASKDPGKDSIAPISERDGDAIERRSQSVSHTHVA